MFLQYQIRSSNRLYRIWLSLIRTRRMPRWMNSSPPDQPEKKLEKETVAAPGEMSREEKSKIIRPLIKKGLKNKEIAEHTGIPLGTVNGLSGSIRKELKNPAKAERIKSGDNSDRHKCRTCQYRHSDAGGCDYCIHTGKERGCDVEICDKAVVGERLTKK